VHHAVDHDVEEVLEEEQAAQAFPRGVRTGNFMHGLLEHLDFADVSREKNESLVQRTMRRFGMPDELEPSLYDWLETIVKTPLSSGTRLSTIARSRRFSELDFFFAVAKLDTRQLNTILQRWDIPPLTGLQERSMTGLLNGQIDLSTSMKGASLLSITRPTIWGRPRTIWRGSWNMPCSVVAMTAGTLSTVLPCIASCVSALPIMTMRYILAGWNTSSCAAWMAGRAMVFSRQDHHWV
jgi:hypothetical protein